MKSYVIKMRGLYIKESVIYGIFHRTSKIDQAMEFTNLADVRVYIENELKLNIANVTVIEIETTTTTKEITL